MANLTITVDEATLRRARIRAIERGESVNRFLADQLRRYADGDTEDARWQRDREHWMELTERYAGRRSTAAWTRDDLHADRFARYEDRA